MCRHLGWFGAPRTLASLIMEPPHGLLTQSWAPRRQAHGTINADGWGVGFFSHDSSDPVRWRSDKPLWSDANFAAMAPLLSASRVVAAVRSASPGMPLDATSAAPFCAGDWLVSHNGRVDRDVVGVRSESESMCDSALLAARVVADGVDQLAGTVRTIADGDPAARLNLILISPDQLLATTWGDTLSWQQHEDGVLVASEPDDTPGWVDVPDRTLLTVTTAGVTLTSLEESR